MTNDPRHGMFLLQGDTLVGLDETPYDSEDLSSATSPTTQTCWPAT